MSGQSRGLPRGSGDLRLTDTMRSHLREMVAAPFWTPRGAGEKRTAEALLTRGLVVRHLEQWGTVYEITEAGREAALDGH